MKLLYLTMKTFFGVLALLWKLYIAVIFTFFAILLYPFFFVVLFRPEWKKFSFKLFIFWSWMMRIFCFYHVKTIERNDLPDVLHYLITTKKCDPHIKDEHNRTLVFLAVMNDKPKILNYLVKRVSFLKSYIYWSYTN